MSKELLHPGAASEPSDADLDRPVKIDLIKTPPDFQILDITMLAGRIPHEILGGLTLPQGVDFGKGIVIYGRAPIWLYARLIILVVIVL